MRWKATDVCMVEMQQKEAEILRTEMSSNLLVIY